MTPADPPRPEALCGPQVDAFLRAVCERYDGVLERLDRCAGSEWVPGVSLDSGASKTAAAVLRQALDQAREGDWERLLEAGAAFASEWVKRVGLDRGALTQWVQAVRPLVYPALLGDPDPVVLEQRLLGFDALIVFFSGFVSREMDDWQREVERDALFLRSVVENLPSMIFVKSADDLRFVRWNRAAEDLVGYSAAEMLGKTDHDLFPADEADFFVENDRDVLRRQELVDIPEEPILTRHRGVRYLHTRKIPILGSDGRPEFLLGISDDITERKQFLHELRLAKDAAEQADHAKGEFLARMSHEIRTPLNGIIGMTDLVLESELAEEQREGLGMVLSSAESLLRLVNEVLDFSKLEAGKLELERVAFALSAQVEETVGGFRMRARAQGLELRVELADDLPRRVTGDPHRLRQVLSNLLDNALRFTHEGSVRVEVRHHTEGLRFSVCDTGMGIPPDKIELIFSPFDQADGTITRRYGGSGLGLAICRRLVEGMGGAIWVESSDAGSQFHFTLHLPAANGEAAEPSASQAGPALPGLRVLLAEDNLVNRTLAVRLLEGMGHSVEVAVTGQQVLDVLDRDRRFDPVLMDVQMPEMSGLEAARSIRESERGRVGHLPILALTARALAGDRERCLEAGMDGYVEKPVRRPQLLRAIAEVLHLRSNQT